ncbi:MAG: hypothetical protein FJX76_19505 [Armatimonadetes bacterium]|nr:hypothetical protein [Armatimonadota bacterium]
MTSSILTLAANTAPPAAQPQQRSEQPAAGTADPKDQVSIGKNPGDVPEPTQVERLLDSSTVAQLVGKQMKGGETITISADGKTVLEIKKDSVSAFQNFKVFAGDVFSATSAEVSNIVGQDPAFAFKESALAVKDQVFRGVPTEFQTVAEQGFLPMIRVVALALDGKKAMDTFKNPDSSRVDKFVDGAHLATDIAGLGGAIAFAIPSVGTSVATALTVVGLVGDIAAYGYHVMKYFHDRGMPNPDEGRLNKQQQQPAPAPQQPQPAKP